MDVWKLHALGNNFVFVLHDGARDHPHLARVLCRMDTAIGADGLLSVEMAAIHRWCGCGIRTARLISAAAACVARRS